MTRKPLEGIRVLDLTRVLAGPYCTMVLANLGAEIIKIERPGTGDDSRDFGPFVNGESIYFISINRGKKSIAIDLKTKEGKELLLDLVKEVDVLAENFRPGTMEKLGLGYDVLKEANPRLIYAAMSGFGHSGPYSMRAAYDMIVQGMGGIMSITGQPGGQPTRVGTSVGDITAGLFGVIGIVSSLISREATGKGQKVDVAMLDGQVSILENAIARYTAAGEIPQPLGSRHPSITPFEAFKTKDSWAILAVGNDALWKKFCTAVNREDLIDDPRFATNDQRNNNHDSLKPIIDEIFIEKTTDEWLELLNTAGIPASPINSVDKLFTDPQVEARNMLVEVDQPGVGKIKIAGNPIKLSDIPAQEEIPEEPAPSIGQHTEEILKDLLGLEETRVKELRDKKVVE
ncbi:MAG TPA: CaiB/BaiF CoA-transferase family protein [Clostridia bacterium]|nr:CaiB/BaiF CoA-transferase family protein [Clostridia bacterium]